MYACKMFTSFFLGSHFQFKSHHQTALITHTVNTWYHWEGQLFMIQSTCSSCYTAWGVGKGPA